MRHILDFSIVEFVFISSSKYGKKLLQCQLIVLEQLIKIIILIIVAPLMSYSSFSTSVLVEIYALWYLAIRACKKTKPNKRLKGYRAAQGSLFIVTSPVDFNKSLENNQKFSVVKNWQ